MTDEAAAEWLGIGERVREAREAAQISVRELARRVEVSPSHVSQVERGLASFSVRALYNVVNVLGISMDSLFEDGRATSVTPPGSPGGDAALPGPGEDPLAESLIVQRRSGRPSIPLAGGTRWERLTPKPEVGAEFIEVVYPPAEGAPPPTDFIRHSSREYGLVLEGSLTVQVGFDQTVLDIGDSIAFDSVVPHRFWNETAEEVRAAWFIWDNARPGDAPQVDQDVGSTSASPSSRGH